MSDINQAKGLRGAKQVLMRLGQLERALTFAGFAVMTGVLFADVASREITGSGLLWARQIGVYANIVVVMVGIGLASADGAHLRPRFADHWLPRRFEPLIVHLQEGVMALYCAGFAWLAVIVVLETFELNERSVILRIVTWPFQAMIPLAFCFATLRHALFAIYPQLRPSDVPGADKGTGNLPGAEKEAG